MHSDTSKQGALFAIAAYGFWGLIPLYFKSVEAASAAEILVQRIIWTVVLLGFVLLVRRKITDLITVLKNWALLKRLIISSLLVSVNWLIFIWAVNNGQVLETSLGYYINPLVSVFLAMIVLKETLSRLQWLAISIAAIGVLYQLIIYGKLPWVAISLALSFGGYGLVRKQISVDPFIGLMVETLLLMPFALGYFLWLQVTVGTAFFGIGGSFALLLMLSGFITAFPLVTFAAAANRLSLTTLGIFQYLAPSVSFILAVNFFGETFGISEIITFTFIWTALLIFCIDSQLPKPKPADN